MAMMPPLDLAGGNRGGRAVRRIVRTQSTCCGDAGRRALPGAPFRRLLAVASVGALVLTASGCAILGAGEEVEQIERTAYLTGSVSAEGMAEDATGKEGQLVVLLLGTAPDENAGRRIVDHFALAGPGLWFFSVIPGRYAVVAFWDRDGDLVYDPGEPALIDESVVYELEAGERLTGIELQIPADGSLPIASPIDVRIEEERSTPEQIEASLAVASVRGWVVQDFDSPFFGLADAERGLYRPLEFIAEGHPGIYFWERYDETRIPVLFVHGVAGSPAQFTALARALDGDRFQPWFYYYPSGLRLERTAANLSKLVHELHARLGFDRLFIVAHSAGGLVARRFLQLHPQIASESYSELLITLATPWGGHAAASFGVDHAPVVLPVWRDLAPGSEFLDQLFPAPGAPHPVPDRVVQHLLFAFRRKSASLGESGDGVVSLRSELRPEAQDEARSQRGFDVDHTGILESPAAISHVTSLLDAAAGPE